MDGVDLPQKASGFLMKKELDYFAGQKTVSFDLLKTVQQFVAGYEVEACPLSLWEIAILKGYEVYRQVKDNSGGIVTADPSTPPLPVTSIRFWRTTTRNGR